jgi:hypothetical protein
VQRSVTRHWAVPMVVAVMGFTVARTGSSVVSFYSMDFLDPDGAEIPDAVVRAQVDKLK